MRVKCLYLLYQNFAKRQEWTRSADDQSHPKKWPMRKILCFRIQKI